MLHHLIAASADRFWWPEKSEDMEIQILKTSITCKNQELYCSVHLVSKEDKVTKYVIH